MNYLGHIYLSGNDDQLLVGNFIGDYVKGKQYLKYPETIQKGILFHREIDHFTDQNEHWKQVREMLKPIYKKYAGVVADIFIDHFLARNWNQYSDEQLSWYSKRVYAVFLQHFDMMPTRVQGFLPYLIQHRRLQSYAKIKGLDMSLRIMSYRTSLPENTDVAIEFLKKNYKKFDQHSTLFLKEINRNKTELFANI